MSGDAGYDFHSPQSLQGVLHPKGQMDTACALGSAQTASVPDCCHTPCSALLPSLSSIAVEQTGIVWPSIKTRTRGDNRGMTGEAVGPGQRQ